jgi:uncharacterized protein YicC (UPF0701 family)
VSVEIRGVNQRFLDVKVTLPREYAAWESEIRERVRGAAERGRVDVAVTRTPVAARRRFRVGVRDELAERYVDATGGSARLGISGEVTTRRSACRSLRDERGDARARARAAALKRARDGVEGVRASAGGRGCARRSSSAVAGSGSSRARSGSVPAATEAFVTRVRERLAKLEGLPDIEPQRIAQELVTLAERGDITEELVRLDHHLQALAATLKSKGAIGKRVEFLIHEIQPELNTTGSKAADLTINGLVVEGKAEVEKLREQVQNVE